jgi:hypothetical protein
VLLSFVLEYNGLFSCEIPLGVVITQTYSWIRSLAQCSSDGKNKSKSFNDESQNLCVKQTGTHNVSIVRVIQTHL